MVPGWPAGLVEAQYGSEPPESWLNVEGRELIVDGQPVGLSPLEFGVMHYLWQWTGKAVSRVDLLEEVWGYEYDGGRNVVDSVIRSLRKKLNHHAAAIETVTGLGYRFGGFSLNHWLCFPGTVSANKPSGNKPASLAQAREATFSLP